MSGTAGGRCCARAKAGAKTAATASRRKLQPETAFFKVICMFMFLLSTFENCHRNPHRLLLRREASAARACGSHDPMYRQNLHSANDQRYMAKARMRQGPAARHLHIVGMEPDRSVSQRIRGQSPNCKPATAGTAISLGISNARIDRSCWTILEFCRN